MITVKNKPALEAEVGHTSKTCTLSCMKGLVTTENKTKE